MATTTTTSQIDPALLPYLQTALQTAQNLFLTGPQPTFFPGQTYVSPSAQTLQALQQQQNLASQQSPLLQQAQQTFLQGMNAQSAAMPLFQNIYGAAGNQAGASTFQQAAQGKFQNIAQSQLQRIAGGQYLNSNPYQQQMMQAATRPLQQQFQNEVLPGISSLYSKSGRLGSGAMSGALAQSTEAQTRALGDITSNIAGTQYQAERGLQQQALGQLASVSQQNIANQLAGAQALQQAQQAQLQAQLGAASGLAQTQAQSQQAQMAAALAAPQVYAAQYLPSQQLANVGAAQEAIAAQPLQQQIAQYQFNQQLPYQQLQGFLSAVYGSPMGGYGTQTSTMPTYQNTGAGILGGALAGGLGGYALGQAFPQIGNFMGGFGAPVLGAIGGGLLGGLF